MRDSQMRELGFFNRKNFILESEGQSIDKNKVILENLEFVVKNRETDSRYLLNKFNLTNHLEFSSFIKCVLSPSILNQRVLNQKMLADKTLHRVMRDSAEESFNFV